MKNLGGIPNLNTLSTNVLIIFKWIKATKSS